MLGEIKVRLKGSDRRSSPFSMKRDYPAAHPVDGLFSSAASGQGSGEIWEFLQADRKCPDEKGNDVVR